MSDYSDFRDVRPAVIQDEAGVVLASVLMNPKAAQKSLEQGEPWIFRGDNGRVLPWEGEDGQVPRMAGLEDRGSWLQVTVAVTAGGASTAPGGITDGKGTGKAVTAAPAGSEGESGLILESLARVIRSRREELPEGSYTTHLFKKGLEKIRKKTGEEAVELILAADPGEIRYEAADLIYHMLVLLEAAEVPLSEVLAELKSRE